MLAGVIMYCLNIEKYFELFSSYEWDLSPLLSFLGMPQKGQQRIKLTLAQIQIGINSSTIWAPFYIIPVHSDSSISMGIAHNL